jgi:hypothetical protein
MLSLYWLITLIQKEIYQFRIKKNSFLTPFATPFPPLCPSSVLSVHCQSDWKVVFLKYFKYDHLPDYLMIEREWDDDVAPATGIYLCGCCVGVIVMWLWSLIGREKYVDQSESLLHGWLWHLRENKTLAT